MRRHGAPGGRIVSVSSSIIKYYLQLRIEVQGWHNRFVESEKAAANLAAYLIHISPSHSPASPGPSSSHSIPRGNIIFMFTIYMGQLIQKYTYQSRRNELRLAGDMVQI